MNEAELLAEEIESWNNPCARAAAELRRLVAINAELVEALQKSMKYVGFAFAKDLIGAEEFGLECEELIKKAKQ